MSIRQTVKRIAPVIKRVSPGLYDFAIKKLSSETVRTLRSIHKIPGENRRFAENAPRFAIEIGGRMGLGAMMSWAVGVLAYCDERNLKPRLRFTNPVYGHLEGEDWFDRYFVRKGPLCDGPGEQPITSDRFVSQSINLQRRLRDVYARLTLERAHDLFVSAIGFREELLDEANDFCQRHGIGENTIGVHFRGTDKRYEATRVQWADIAAQVDACSVHRQGSIFVATDEPEFLEFMRGRFTPGRVLDLDCQEIFSGSPAHLTSGNSAVKGSEAIRTILILSRCGVLLRTRSHLSAWSRILNPSMPTIVFGHMLGGDQFDFPEHMISTNVGNDGISPLTEPVV